MACHVLESRRLASGQANKATDTYTNNSTDLLRVLWVNLYKLSVTEQWRIGIKVVGTHIIYETYKLTK